jgi:hypothetical protein
LICGGVYDWSTGLIFKGGRYFDPSLGIWLALTPLVVLQSWRGRRRRRRGMRWYVVAVVVIVGVGGILAGCVPPEPGDGTPSLEQVCDDRVPRPGDFKMSIILQEPEPIVRKALWPGAPEMWQAALGVHPTDDPNEAGTHIQGEVTPPEGFSGEVKFEQHIKAKHLYTFEGMDKRFDFTHTDKWYLDGGTPYGGSETYPCGSKVCGYMLDSPGTALQVVHKETGSLLIEYERWDEFETYLLWYPFPACPIPLAKVNWSWYVITTAIKDEGMPSHIYPLKWDVVEWGTDPPIGVEKLGEGVDSKWETPKSMPEAPDFTAFWTAGEF